MRIVIQCDKTNVEEMRIAYEIQYQLESSRQVYGLPVIVEQIINAD